MKKFYLLFLLALCFCCNRMEPQKINAEVLTIETYIMKGYLIGQFLGSSSGSFDTDIIKVGVKFEFGNKLYLEDLELRHAEVAYYKDQNFIILEVTCSDESLHPTLKFKLDATKRTLITKNECSFRCI